MPELITFYLQIERPDMFQSLKKPLLCKEVEEQIKSSIYKGVYKNNDKLPSEQELVKQFQVSRSTVREALKNIQNMGMISIKRGINAGAYVAELSSLPITQSIENLFQVGRISFSHLLQARLYIEPSVSAHAATYHTQEDIDKLQDLLNAADNLSAKSVWDARLKNCWFHVELARITRNPIIIFLSESITNVLANNIIDMTRDRISEKMFKKAMSEHRDILECIADRNDSASFKMTQRHLLNSYNLYSKVITDPCKKEEMEQLFKNIEF